MRQLWKFVCLACLLSLGACKEEEEPSLIPDYYWGEASALKNGKEWQPLIYGITLRGISRQYGILMDVFSEQGFRRERLTFGYLKKDRIDSFPVLADSIFKNENNFPNELIYSDSCDATHSTMIDDGDVVGDFYDVDQTKDNYIEIVEYDEESGEVSGRFEVTFILTYDSPWTPDSPDTVKFTNGVFKTKIWDELE